MTSGQLFTTTDPTVAQPGAVAVQIQNSSGFLITVQMGGANYLIQPFAASTIPTRGSYQINVTPGAPQASFGALISFAWLQPNEPPPMADGPLTQGNTQSLGLLSVTTVITSGAIYPVLPTPPLGYVYSIFSVTATFGGGGNCSVLLEGPGGAPLYREPNFPATGDIVSTNSLVVSTALTMQSLPNTSTTVTTRYDLFPQPIS